MYIYLITNLVNGKIYVGKWQGRQLQDRLAGHVRLAMREDGKTRLARAMRKYGPSAFIIEPLVYDVWDARALCALEECFIALLDAQNGNIGYNVAAGVGGGRVGAVLSRSTRAKISSSLKGKFAGSANPAFGKNYKSMLGKRHTEETKDKLRKANAGGTNTYFSDHRFFGAANGFFGKKHSALTKSKMRGPRPSMRGRKQSAAHVQARVSAHAATLANA